MPPLTTLSDEDASASDQDIQIASKDTADEGSEDSQDDEDDEVYVVEKIWSHTFDADGAIKFEVEWEGYKKKSDRTWEPEGNLESAKDAVEDYFTRIGGRPSKSTKGRKRKLSRVASGAPEAPKESAGQKKAKSEEVEWTPPKGSWENDVLHIDTVEELPNPKTGQKERFVYLVWNNTKKTQHPIKVVNQKCPQKMLQYYEQHLVFKVHEEDEGSENAAHETNGKEE